MSRLDDDLDPWEMLGQRAAGSPALLGTGAMQQRISLLLLRLDFGDGLFEILKREIQLVGIEPLRAAAVLHALKLAEQAVVLAGELVALGRKLRLLGTLGIAFGPGHDEHRAQHTNVVGGRLGSPVQSLIGS